MAKRLVRIMAILLVAVMAVSVVAFAAPEPGSFQGVGNTGGADTAVTNAIGGILTVAQIIGVGVAVIMLIVLAIKYIAASPGDKAEIKKHAVVYVVGAIVLFAASGILGIIKKFAEANFNS